MVDRVMDDGVRAYYHVWCTDGGTEVTIFPTTSPLQDVVRLLNQRRPRD